MRDVTRFSGSTIKYALLALAVLGAKVAWAAPNGEAELQPQTNCKRYEGQEQLEALKRADPSIHAARLDLVSYSVYRNGCLASVFFTKGDDTYSGIFDIAAGRMLWAKGYKGTSFSPVDIVGMDQEMDEKAKELESAPISNGNSHSFYFLPDLLDRTKNTFPAIKNSCLQLKMPGWSCGRARKRDFTQAFRRRTRVERTGVPGKRCLLGGRTPAHSRSRYATGFVKTL